MIDRVKAVVQLNHLWHNYQMLKQIHHDKRVMAVVKADAYGHGAVEVASYLEQKGCSYFAVTDLIEGMELRDRGIRSSILIFGKTSPKHANLINEYDLIQTVDSLEYAKKINDNHIDIKTHLIIDTGMSRFGIYCHREEDLSSTLREIKDILKLKHIHNQGIYTHFAVADDEKDNITHQQFYMFQSVCLRLENEGYNLGIKHCSNSASILKFPNFQMDMVRAGIAMYGYPPVETRLEFLPVMNVFAKVIAIRNLKPGDGIGYGLSYLVEKPMKVASIAIGYADGYDRLLSNQDFFLFHDHRLPVLGRVCMGVTMVDVSQCDIKVGMFVEVFGQNKPLELMANSIGTITYELLTNMSKKRVKFIYEK